jgi:hypothetical protein
MGSSICSPLNASTLLGRGSTGGKKLRKKGLTKATPGSKIKIALN